MQKKTSNETTYYSGSFIYEGSSLKQILHSEGYIDMSGTPTYHYYLKDHLGNNRMVVNQVGTVAQQTDFYPFGMAFNEYSNVDNKYLYNGKEMQKDAIGNGLLDWYDYGARMYDPALGRWHVMDPLAEKYAGESSFAYVGNNPIKFVDPDGMQYGDPDSGGTPAKFDEKTGNLTEARSSIRPVIDSNNLRYEISKTQLKNISTFEKSLSGTIKQGLSPYERAYQATSPEWSRPLVESKLMQSMAFGILAAPLTVAAIDVAPSVAFTTISLSRQVATTTISIQAALESSAALSGATGFAYGYVTSSGAINLPHNTPSPVSFLPFELGSKAGELFRYLMETPASSQKSNTEIQNKK